MKSIKLFAEGNMHIGHVCFEMTYIGMWCTVFNNWIINISKKLFFLHTQFWQTKFWCLRLCWVASSEFGTYRLCKQQRFRRACTSAQSRQNLRYSLIQAVSQEELSDRKPDPWLLWMAGHAQSKFVMAEWSKTQIRLMRLMLYQALFLPIYNSLFM